MKWLHLSPVFSPPQFVSQKEIEKKPKLKRAAKIILIMKSCISHFLMMGYGTLVKGQGNFHEKYWGDNIYQYAPEALTWDEHEKRAVKWGGHLVSIHSQEEAKVVKDITVQHGGTYKGVWLGGKRKKDVSGVEDAEDGGSNMWQWSDGTPFDYTRWATGEPNNNNDKINEDVIEQWPADWGYPWNDIPQSYTRAAVYKKYYTVTWYDKDYRYASEALTWDEHEKRAVEWGGHLVSIHSQEEAEVVKDITVQYGGYHKVVWIGGKRKKDVSGVGDSKDGTSRMWQWSDGTLFDYTKWAIGEPNNDNDNKIEDVIEQFIAEGFYRWKDKPRSYTRAAVYKRDYKVTWEDKDYRYAPEALTWDEHEKRAVEWGGHLVSIHSLEEAKVVKDITVQHGGTYKGVWLGGKRKKDVSGVGDSKDGTSRMWQWSDGTPFDYTKWATGEPNNNNDKINEDVIEQWPADWGYPWNDIPQSYTRAAVYKRDNTVTWHDKDYRYASEALTWDEHEKRAVEWGGHLVSIHSQEEAEVVKDITVQYGGKYKVIWIGGKRKKDVSGVEDSKDGTSRMWQWSDGTPFDYTKWATGEPNNDNDNKIEDVIEQWPAGFFYSWKDKPRSYTRAAVYKRDYTVTWEEKVYRYAPEALTWDEHEKRAVEWGGHLVSIHSQEEAEVVYNFTTQHGGPYEQVWLGGKRKKNVSGVGDSKDGTSRMWQWSDGTPFDYTRWAIGEPNNNNDKINEDVIEQGPRYKGYTWNDIPWSDTRAAVYKKYYTVTWEEKVYRYAPEALTWDEHEKQAVEWGGHLVSIHSHEEAKVVKDIILQYGGKYEYVWLGGKRKRDVFGVEDAEDGSSNMWQWSDGTPFDYTRWAIGEPNNCNDNKIEDVIEQWPAGGLGYRWNDFPRSDTRAAVYKKRHF